MSEGVWGWRAINAASVFVYLFLFAPIMVTMLLSFNASEFGGFPMTGFSLHWFGVLMQNDIVLAAVRRSLILGALTAVICTVLGILAATALVRYEFRGKEWVNTLLVAPVLIPETVLAVGLLLFIRWLHAPLLSLASGFHWTDTTQGFRAYSRRMLEDPRVAPFREIFQKYELLAYLSYRAPKLGYRCIELPTLRRYPKDEKVSTKISPFRGEFEVLQTLITVCRGGFDPT